MRTGPLTTSTMVETCAAVLPRLSVKFSFDRIRSKRCIVVGEVRQRLIDRREATLNFNRGRAQCRDAGSAGIASDAEHALASDRITAKFSPEVLPVSAMLNPLIAVDLLKPTLTIEGAVTVGFPLTDSAIDFAPVTFPKPSVPLIVSVSPAFEDSRTLICVSASATSVNVPVTVTLVLLLFEPRRRNPWSRRSGHLYPLA